MELDRRTVLQATGMLATAGVLAACGSSGAPEDAASSASGESPSEESQGADATGGSTGSALAQTSDVPVGGGIILAEPAVVITQPTEGDVKAFTAICPHQGCLVSEVVDNQIICPCHGSRFSAQDGSVIEGPAMQGLTSAGIAVEGGSVVLS